MSIKVLRPGLLTTVQDLGRYGYQQYGVIVGGAMDLLALHVANILVGNEETAAAIEITLAGPKLQFSEDTLIAICGANLSPKINGQEVPLWRSVLVKQGSVLQFGKCLSGCRAYLSVAGGIDVPVVMGSRSTYTRAAIGGYSGRALQEGDTLERGDMSSVSADLFVFLLNRMGEEGVASTNWCVSRELWTSYSSQPRVRVIPGPQFSCFTPDSQKHFLTQSFRITPQSDRMGYRLQGPNLELTEPMELISEAVTYGTIQVPPAGNPIVLMADRQTTGGYPKIAYVATVDLPLLAQIKPGDSIRFEEINLQNAQELILEREQQLQWAKQGLRLITRR